MVGATRLEDGSIKFAHYVVKKKSDRFFAVYTNNGDMITSGVSMGDATKKAKLLETGFQHAKEIYSEW